MTIPEQLRWLAEGQESALACDMPVDSSLLEEAAREIENLNSQIQSLKEVVEAAEYRGCWDDAYEPLRKYRDQYGK